MSQETARTKRKETDLNPSKLGALYVLIKSPLYSLITQCIPCERQRGGGGTQGIKQREEEEERGSGGVRRRRRERGREGKDNDYSDWKWCMEEKEKKINNLNTKTK